MTRIQRFFLRLYTYLLRFYPVEFYEMFATEMEDTFRSLLHEHSGSVISLGLREIALLVLAIIRERQQEKYQPLMLAFRWQLAILMIPVLLGLGIMAFRSVHIFYTSHKFWAIFTVGVLVITAFGWLKERRLTALAMPSLGFLLFVLVRALTLPAEAVYGIPLEVRLLIPSLILIIVLVRYSTRPVNPLPWIRWVPFVLASLLMSLITVIAAMHLPPTPTAWLSSLDIWLKSGFGALITSGTGTLLILMTMPFALSSGAKAVLILVGCMMFDVFSFAGSLPYDEQQRAMGAFLVVLFLLVIPLFFLHAQRRWVQVASIFTGVTLAHIAGFAANGAYPNYAMYRLNEWVQALLILGLALTIYSHLERPRKAKPAVIEKQGIKSVSA